MEKPPFRGVGGQIQRNEMCCKGNMLGGKYKGMRYANLKLENNINIKAWRNLWDSV